MLTFHIRVFDLFLLKQCIPFSFFTGLLYTTTVLPYTH